MSRAELERLVADAEQDPGLRECLKACGSQPEFLLAVRNRGYHITRIDLLRAWQDHAIGVSRRASGG